MFRCYFILLLVLRSGIIATQKSKELNENVQMQVRAVFINCELNENDSNFAESESSRFTQEELFKHGSLTNCNKKLALTVKLSGEADGKFEDEYVPIEHVINGPSKRRTRLLNPYILRLRRETPLQAYELRKIDTVRGIVTNNEEDSNLNIKRHLNKFTQGNMYPYQDDIQSNLENQDPAIIKKLKQTETKENEEGLLNVTFNNRFKRQGYTNEAQSPFEEKNPMWIPTDNLISEINNLQQPNYGINNQEYNAQIDDQNTFPKIKKHQRLSVSNNRKSDREEFGQKLLPLIDNQFNTEFNEKYVDNLTTMRPEFEETQIEPINNINIVEKPYALYEIGTPDLWSTVHVQLFEKLSTPDGQTVWNDITKGESASVSSSVPDWGNDIMNIKYQNTEWVAREDFTFPTTGLCLVSPIRDAETDHLVDSINFINGQDYFVLPTDAIITLEDSSSLMKRSHNESDSSSSTEYLSKNQYHRRVQIRLSRALFGGSDKKMSIASRGNGRYLTMPFQQPCHGQIDLEAKADENELVTVGSSGRITTAVSDSTRPTSTSLSIQTTNSGLAAARFRAVIRDCHPTLTGEVNKKSEKIVTDRVLIAPKQTQMLKLQMLNDVPVELSHCAVALINDFDEQVAVRDVTIKKGDRCFCVWHCDCVCLSEDPKLLCREMPVTRQIAAGLSAHNRRRHARSVCYHDITSVDVCVVIIGVITALLMLVVEPCWRQPCLQHDWADSTGVIPKVCCCVSFGLLKALIGLFVPIVRNWGLDRILQTPRKLDQYYEKSLSSRPVVYDADGWPVHPDTKKRTVHLISRPMEFILNLIFFIVTPCLIVRNGIKTMISRFKSPEKTEKGKKSCKESKKCFSSQDIQSVKPRWRQRGGDLRRWMTPQAEELSTDLWQKALPSRQPINSELMQPLLHEDNYRNSNGMMEGHDSCVDSEQDDTEYVLMQMKKSKESLKRSQRRFNDSEGLLPKTYHKQSGDLSSGRNN